MSPVAAILMSEDNDGQSPELHTLSVNHFLTLETSAPTLRQTWFMLSRDNKKVTAARADLDLGWIAIKKSSMVLEVVHNKGRTPYTK